MKNSNRYFPYLFLTSVIILDLIIFYALMKVLNVWEKELTAAILGLIGSVLGGFLTLVGVKMTLDNQAEQGNAEARNREKMLFTQLRFTFDMFYAISNHPNGIIEISTSFIVYDKEWNKHIVFIENLSAEEFRLIINWFYCMHQLEDMSSLNNGTISSQQADVLLRTKLNPINEILMKYGY
ncbi:hypothetical protein CHH83_20835 [Bacillus sp. 7586-K]|nr:hypothetical protein CHH83_20835 [Bacillus sp. 7586-K]